MLLGEAFLRFFLGCVSNVGCTLPNLIQVELVKLVLNAELILERRSYRNVSMFVMSMDMPLVEVSLIEDWAS